MTKYDFCDNFFLNFILFYFILFISSAVSMLVCSCVGTCFFIRICVCACSCVCVTTSNKSIYYCPYQYCLLYFSHSLELQSFKPLFYYCPYFFPIAFLFFPFSRFFFAFRCCSCVNVRVRATCCTLSQYLQEGGETSMD